MVLGDAEETIYTLEDDETEPKVSLNPKKAIYDCKILITVTGCYSLLKNVMPCYMCEAIV